MPEPYRSEHDGYLKNYLSGRPSRIIRKGRELIGLRKDGVTFPLELHVGDASFGKGRVFVGFIKDIFARKEMEAKNRHFQAIVMSSADAIISKTLNGIVTSWNPAAEFMFGFSAAEMIGDSLLKLFPPERHEEEKVLLEKIAGGEQVNQYETVRIHKNGSTIDVSVTLSPILDEMGNIVGVAKIARDITRAKQLEHELSVAKQAAEAASRAKSEFLANMSHEIRTPMNAIIGLTRLVMETELSPKQQDYLRKIQASSQALLGILNDILDLSKIESGRLDIEHIEFDPALMLQGVSDLFVAKAEEKGLELFLDVAPEIPLTMVGDPLRIQQVLSNLVSNAIKFTPKGEIHVRMDLDELGPDDLQLRLSVRDTGIGISKTAIEKLFKPFSQADASTTRKFGGTGLGLVISKQLVELMGGSISIDSEPEQGSTIAFAIPCGKGQPYNWTQDSQNIKDSRVLVVDDQTTSCDILKSILESWHLYVETALSGEEALQKIHEANQAGSPFNLLLLDWKMDGMSGLELAYELTQMETQGKLKHQPTIIMVTAYSKDYLLNEASSLSVRLDAILTKPVLPSSLLNTVLHVFHYQGKDTRIPKIHINPYEVALPLRNTRILLVEDNELNQQVASEFLEKAGLRVSIANHGGEAVQWIQRKTFDAVLMDLQMPEMDGYEATRQIRALPACRELPIIAMTAAAMAHDREACLAVGMNDHIAKPISPRELIDTLLRWIKPGNPLSLPAIHPENQAARGDLAARLPGFELTDIMTMLAGDQDRLIGMLGQFREQFLTEGPAIAALITKGDLPEAEQRLHKLKGAAGNLGANDLHRACAELDNQLVSGVYDTVTLAHWLETLSSTLATIADLPSQTPSVAPNITPVEAQALWQVMAELDVLLDEDAFISNQLLDHLKSLLPNDFQKNHEQLVQAIMDDDYLAARDILKMLIALSDGKN